MGANKSTILPEDQVRSICEETGRFSMKFSWEEFFDLF